jgi:DNA-binding transcriptional MerR regulator
VDELLSIGDFSARCGLSAKMLRSYAAARLLIPAAVDGSSGYRYYSTGQLHRARVIALLRRAGIAIDDIAEFFDAPDPDTLDRWDRQIVSESKARRQALVEARAALTLGQAPPPAHREASRKGSAVTHTFVSGAATHRGGRDTNQDAVLVGDGLFAVADGVGGLQHGDVASQLALDTLDAASLRTAPSRGCSTVAETPIVPSGGRRMARMRPWGPHWWPWR